MTNQRIDGPPTDSSRRMGKSILRRSAPPIPPAIARGLVMAIGLILLIASCTSSPTRYRGSLSDAMDKARDDHDGDRNVPDEPRGPEIGAGTDVDEPDFGDGTEASNNRNPAPAATNELEYFLFGLRGGSSLYDSDGFVTSFDGDIFLGASPIKHFELNLLAGLKVAEAESGSDLDASVKGPITFLRAGAEGRYEPFLKRDYFSPYLVGGGAAHLMLWSFRNSLSSGGDEISSDSLSGLLLYAGIGAYVVNAENVRLGLSLVQDLYLFGSVTNQGFDNDYFEQYGSARLLAEIDFRH